MTQTATEYQIDDERHGKAKVFSASRDAGPTVVVGSDGKVWIYANRLDYQASNDPMSIVYTD